MKTLIFFLWAFCPGILSAQVVLNLQMCREMALQNSKEIDIAGKQQQKAAFDVLAYRAEYLPKLSVVGLGFYNQKKYNYKLKGGYLPTYKPGADGQLEPNIVVNPENHQPVIGTDGKPVFNEYAFLPDIKLQLGLRGVYSAGVQLLQPVYLGGKVRAAYRIAKAGEEIAGENIRRNRADVVLSVDEAYWQLLRVEEQAAAAAKYLKVVEELLENLKNARAVGMATMNDVLKAQVRYNDARLMLQKARNGSVLARMNLCRLVGLDLETNIRLEDALTAKVNDLIWALDSSVTQRPDYNMLEQEVNLREREEALTRSDFLPQIGLTAGYGYSGGVKLNGDDEANATFSALATVQIPVFHWGEGRNKLRAVRLEKEISLLNLKKSSELMRLEVVSSRFNIEDALTQVQLAQEAFLQAEENLKVSSDQYQVGMENLTSLLEAQAQWQQAWSEWIDAKALLHLSESRYLKAIGRLE